VVIEDPGTRDSDVFYVSIPKDIRLYMYEADYEELRDLLISKLKEELDKINRTSFQDYLYKSEIDCINAIKLGYEIKDFLIMRGQLDGKGSIGVIGIDGLGNMYVNEDEGCWSILDWTDDWLNRDERHCLEKIKELSKFCSGTEYSDDSCSKIYKKIIEGLLSRVKLASEIKNREFAEEYIRRIEERLKETNEDIDLDWHKELNDSLINAAMEDPQLLNGERGLKKLVKESSGKDYLELEDVLDNSKVISLQENRDERRGVKLEYNKDQLDLDIRNAEALGDFMKRVYDESESALLRLALQYVVDTTAPSILNKYDGKDEYEKAKNYLIKRYN